VTALPVSRVHVSRRESGLVRVPELIIKSVAFISYRHEAALMGEDIDPGATAFYVGYPSSIVPGVRFNYFVTAKHALNNKHGGEIGLLVNSTSSGRIFVPFGKQRWYQHPTDNSVDVLVLPFEHRADLAVHYVAIETFLGKDHIDNFQGGAFGLGNEVFFPGLFEFAPGATRNMPFLRYGNVAMIPDGPIQVDSGFAGVYLIESRSISGLSGSPVFMRPTANLDLWDSAKRKVSGIFPLESYVLLGMIGGHWDANPHGVNMGISWVVPARKILEVLNHPELVAARNEYDERLRAAIIPQSD
jgi:hypothetical protein